MANLGVKMWGAIAAIVTTIGGGGLTSTYVIGQVSDVKKEQQDVRKELQTDRKASWQTQQDVEVIKQQIEHLRETTREIKGDVKDQNKKLDELLRRVK